MNSKRLRIAASIAAAITFVGIMFIVSMTVGKTIGHGWEIALIPFDALGGIALGTLIGTTVYGGGA